MSNVVTRFAPSPTGYLHAGRYRTALFSCIFARQNKGKFILRIEDTDKQRSKKEFEENILDSLEWLGLKYDEFFRQSERTDIYKQYLERLIESGHAYISDEISERDKRSNVIRFKNPNKKVSFDDLIRGQIQFDTTELGDFVIAKSMDEPVFHLVNVVDDALMGITHIIRGEDHISNTPRQILIYEALELRMPLYAHIPLLLAKDRSKLSGRHGALSISDYRTKGYLAEAVVNYMALLGWHPADDRELLSFDEIVREFSLERVQKSGAIFDEEKLKWFNKQYISRLDDAGFAAHSSAFVPEWMATSSQLFKNLIPILREKIATFADIPNLLDRAGELGFVKEIPKYFAGLLLWKKNPSAEASRTHLVRVSELLNDIKPKNFTLENIRAAVWPYAEANGKGDVLWPLRAALTGQEKSPDPFTAAFILGKEESLKRLDAAINLLN